MASLSTEADAAAAAAAEAAGSSALEDEIAKAVEEGKGWKEGEREAYLKKVSEEDHPMFAENIEVGALTGCGAIKSCCYGVGSWAGLFALCSRCRGENTTRTYAMSVVEFLVPRMCHLRVQDWSTAVFSVGLQRSMSYCGQRNREAGRGLICPIRVSGDPGRGRIHAQIMIL